MLVFGNFCKNPKSAKNMLIWLKSSAMWRNLHDTPENNLPESYGQIQTLKLHAFP